MQQNRMKGPQALAAGLAVALFMGAAAYSIASSADANRSARDFESFYRAAQHYSNPDHSIYEFRSLPPDESVTPLFERFPDPLGLLQGQREMLAEMNGLDPEVLKAHFLAPYLYPPALAAFLTPFSLLSLKDAHLVWVVLISFALATIPLVSVWSFNRGAFFPQLTAQQQNQLWILTIALSIAFAPVVISELLWSQVNSIVLLLLLVALGLHMRMPAVAGVSFALACLIKMSPAIFLAYFLWRRNWKLLAWCVFGSLVIVGITSFGGGFRHWIDFTSTFFQISADDRMMLGYFPAGSAGNNSLKGLIYRVTSGAGVMPWAVLNFGIIALLAWTGWRTYREQNAGRLIFRLCVVQLLISPMTWQAHYIYLWPACILLLAEIGVIYRISWRSGLAAAIVVLANVAFWPQLDWLTLFPAERWMLNGYTVSLKCYLLVVLYFLPDLLPTPSKDSTEKPATTDPIGSPG
jgi:Glycosyltransferase family 87